MKLFHVVCTILIAKALLVDAYCPEAAQAPLPFVLEYAVWRGWHQAVIYAPDLEQGMSWNMISHYYAGCFLENLINWKSFIFLNKLYEQ